MWQWAVNQSVLPSCRVSSCSSSFNPFFIYKSILLFQALQLGSSWALCPPVLSLLLPGAHLGSWLRKWHHRNALFFHLCWNSSHLFVGRVKSRKNLCPPQVWFEGHKDVSGILQLRLTKATRFPCPVISTFCLNVKPDTVFNACWDKSEVILIYLISLNK